MNLTKTSNLVLLTILIAIGVTSAYAITITLGADPVNILGNLNVDGNTINVFGPLTNDNDRICFDEAGPATKCLTWRDGTDDFGLSRGLFLNGGLVTEGTSTFGFDVIIDGDLDLTGLSDVDDDTIFFDDGVTTFLRWDELPVGEFVLSDDLTVSGNLAASSVTAEDYTFTNPQIRKFVIGSNEFNANAPISYSNANGIGAFFTSGTNPTMFGAIHIPVGSTITQLDCKVIDNAGVHNVNCDLLSYISGAAPSSQAGSVSTGQTGIVQTISTGAISVTINSAPHYFVTFSPSDVACGSNCRLFQATITYEVSTAD